MSAQVLGKFTKQPAEVLDYDVSFAAWFAGRTVQPASHQVVAEPGIDIVADSRTGTTVKVVLGGGTSGARYKVTVRMTTTGTVPLVKEADFIVAVKDA